MKKAEGRRRRKRRRRRSTSHQTHKFSCPTLFLKPISFHGFFSSFFLFPTSFYFYFFFFFFLSFFIFLLFLKHPVSHARCRAAPTGAAGPQHRVRGQRHGPDVELLNHHPSHGPACSGRQPTAQRDKRAPEEGRQIYRALSK